MSPKGTIFINKWVLLALILIPLLCILWYHPHNVNSLSKTGRLNCTQLEAEGHYNIPRSSSLYASYLDGDKNGVACQKD